MWYTVHVHALDRRKFFHLSARSVSLWIYYQQQKLNLFLIRYPDYYMLYSIEQFCLVRLAFWKAITCTHKKTTRQMILEYCASFYCYFHFVTAAWWIWEFCEALITSNYSTCIRILYEELWELLYKMEHSVLKLIILDYNLKSAFKSDNAEKPIFRDFCLFPRSWFKKFKLKLTSSTNFSGLSYRDGKTPRMYFIGVNDNPLL